VGIGGGGNQHGIVGGIIEDRIGRAGFGAILGGDFLSGGLIDVGDNRKAAAGSGGNGGGMDAGNTACAQKSRCSGWWMRLILLGKQHQVVKAVRKASSAASGSPEAKASIPTGPA